MGDYSELTGCSEITVKGMTWDEFQERWRKTVEDDGGDESYLILYEWELNEKDPDALHIDLKCDVCFAKHYSTDKLAKFISEVIAEGSDCVLEFLGGEGPWGFYVTKGSVKDIKYVRMVDGKQIDH